MLTDRPPKEPGSAPSSPDIVVVVMDCVQATEFSRALGTDGGALSELRTESVLFPRAASVAPWTLPSHASLFSGLYPWEHGCHGKGALQLSPKIARIPQWLKRLGYRTYSVSGNPIISPSYGLVDGFDRAAWGEWWERAYRVLETPPNLYEGSEVPSRANAAQSRRRRIARTLTVAAQRAPFIMAATDTILRRLKGLDRDITGSINPWIEPTLGRWLANSPDPSPFFCFINFIDAHEPYLEVAGRPEGSNWWRCLRIPQDSLALLSMDVRLG